MRIVVVGDAILDVDLSGEATRLSPDAPVPVVDVSGIRRRAGEPGWWPGCWRRTAGPSPW